MEILNELYASIRIIEDMEWSVCDVEMQVKLASLKERIQNYVNEVIK